MSKEQIIADGTTLGVVGVGVMGQTLLRGLLASGLVARDRLWAGDKNAATCESASEALGIPVKTDFQQCVPSADLVLVCVKPLDAAAVMNTLVHSGMRPTTLLISILAGVSTESWNLF